jgi:chemotaxis protein histidine kinase CheA
METEIVKIEPKEFGLDENQVKTIESAFMPKIVERDGLKEIYEGIITKEITPELCQEAKSVRLKLVKIRTGISEIHKTQKAFYLAAGRFVDAWKNKETLPVTQMEENLQAIEEHYERIEAEKIKKLQEERSAEIASFQEIGSFIPGNLGELNPEVYANYLLGVKTAFEQKKEHERIAKEAEEKRIADEKAENERIRVENEKLKKEAEEKEAALKAEREKADAERKEREAKEAKEQAEREAKERKEKQEHEAALEAERKKAAEAQRLLEEKADAERKEREAKEAKEQAELSKGDAAKIIDLIVDLKALKGKYQFKAKKNQKLYANTGLLIDKIINYINENQ